MKKRILETVTALILSITMLTSCGSSETNTAGLTSDDSLKTDTIRDSGIYVAGVYTSILALGNTNIELQITVDKNHINSIYFVNMDESITTLYPLMKPTLNELSETIISKQSIEDISYSEENRYTANLLMQAITEALDKARVL